MPINNDESLDSEQMTPRELHAAAFGEKSRMDVERLSLAQQSLFARTSSQIEGALLKRAKMAQQIQQNLSSSAAIQKLSELDPSGKNFSKNVNSIIADHPEVLSSAGGRSYLQSRRADRANFLKAETPDIISNPQASTRFNNILANGGSPEEASAGAKAALENYKQSTKLAASPYLSSDDKSKFYNEQSGEHTLDSTILNQMQIKSDTGEQQEKMAKEGKASHDEAFALLRGLNKNSPLDTTTFPSAGVDPKDRTPEQQQANNAAWNAYKLLTGSGAPAAAVGPKGPSVDDEAKRLLGTAPQPAAPAAAPTPAPSQTPTPPTKETVAQAEPGGDELAKAEAKA